MLMNILKNTINEAVDNILGRVNYKKPHTNDRTLRLTERIGHVLHLNGKLCFSPHAPKSLDDELIRADIVFLTKKGITLPLSTPEWIAWWPQRLSILKTDTIKTLNVKDSDFLKNPKHTYRMCCKPNASSKISSLKVGSDLITSDWEIEKELTNYVKTICGQEQKENLLDTPYIPTRNNPDYIQLTPLEHAQSPDHRRNPIPDI